MEYKAIYRQWRPATFDELLGQEAITNTIKNALLTGKVSHAYLFTGSRGTGKTSTAKLIAKALNCLDRNGANPCGKCDSCISIDKGSFMDVLEIDGASNRGIDEIRELKEKLAYAPSEGKYKVYIIDEVHMLTNEAFNALLKTLEEPPDRVVFILATTEPQKLPATIRSGITLYSTPCSCETPSTRIWSVPAPRTLAPILLSKFWRSTISGSLAALLIVVTP
jgi:DNA polymerase-3 subunit gamma/tau